MSQEERFGTRDLTYSAWHRRNSTKRFVGIEHAQTLAMIDLDTAIWVEYDDGDKEPLALIEVAQDVGQFSKTATVTARLAARCTPILPAYVLLYRKAPWRNQASPQYADIDQFRIRRIHPRPETSWEILSPQQWADRLVRLRQWCASQIDRTAA